MIASFDCRFGRILDQMEHDAQQQNLRATELTAWARLNESALHQRNARTLHKQWEDTNHHLELMEGNDIPKLIWRTGGFDMTNVDSKYNLDRMVVMQDEAAARD